MCHLLDLPFNHLETDDEFSAALTSLRYDKSVIDYEKLTQLKLNIFDTNVNEYINLPSFMNDPDINCTMYKNLANDLMNVCDYYTVESLSQRAKKLNGTEFSLLHLNVRSLPAHIDELDLYLKSTLHDFKVIGLSETRLKQINQQLYNMNGYNSVHKTRLDQEGGGVSLLLDSSLDLQDIAKCTIWLKSFN